MHVVWINVTFWSFIICASSCVMYTIFCIIKPIWICICSRIHILYNCIFDFWVTVSLLQPIFQVHVPISVSSFLTVQRHLHYNVHYRSGNTTSGHLYINLPLKMREVRKKSDMYRNRQCFRNDEHFHRGCTTCGLRFTVDYCRSLWRSWRTSKYHKNTISNETAVYVAWLRSFLGMEANINLR